MIIIPIKWLFHWEYTLFSDKPTWIWKTNLVPFPRLGTNSHPETSASRSYSWVCREVNHNSVNLFIMMCPSWHFLMLSVSAHDSAAKKIKFPDRKPMGKLGQPHVTRWWSIISQKSGCLTCTKNVKTDSVVVCTTLIRLPMRFYSAIMFLH